MLYRCFPEPLVDWSHAIAWLLAVFAWGAYTSFSRINYFLVIWVNILWIKKLLGLVRSRVKIWSIEINTHITVNVSNHNIWLQIWNIEVMILISYHIAWLCPFVVLLGVLVNVVSEWEVEIVFKPLKLHFLLTWLLNYPAPCTFIVRSDWLRMPLIQKPTLNRVIALLSFNKSLRILIHFVLTTHKLVTHISAFPDFIICVNKFIFFFESVVFDPFWILRALICRIIHFWRRMFNWIRVECHLFEHLMLQWLHNFAALALPGCFDTHGLAEVL